MTPHEAEIWLEGRRAIEQLIAPALERAYQGYGLECLKPTTDEEQWHRMQGAAENAKAQREALLNNIKTAEALQKR